MAATSDLGRARALLADDPDKMDRQWLAGVIAAVQAKAAGGICQSGNLQS